MELQNRGGIISKKKGFIGAFIVILIIFGFRSFSLHQEQSQIKNDTLMHLENQGYDEETDIKEIYIVEILEKDENDEIEHTEKYEAVVHFQDEPSNAYFYRYKKSTNEIIQTDSINEGTSQALKHIE
ncbi:hypothetical protein NC661_04750 [Aquibacillus koreensis]|uniref:DUF3139 domain-containing protein n=1 Tax=Aquibacillus koreensis TaxID=279446 RepID=A0A9X3WLV3_9BACI|nr:hypothetical protein [Aquibacillus koreensis]MCT2534716.1 hypothetical protein [Aquibacillus koreensis]MDC3419674.1 hypothetical protein [Aquibacillus koreensis]